MGTPYTQQVRIERFVTLGRALLAVCALLAVWLNPMEPVKHTWTTYYLLFGFVCYSVLIVLAVWCLDVTWTRLPVISHGIDLILFALLMFFTQGPASPFFVFFVFALVCATLRWQLRGTLYTAAIALSIVVVTAVYPKYLLSNPSFELNRFIIRVSYLTVVAALLGYLGAHEQRLRNELSRLATRPWTVPENAPDLVKSVMEHSSSILVVPRMLLIWEEQEEPWLHVALWSNGQCHYTREAPDAFGMLVTGPLAGTDFFCRNLLDPTPIVLHSSSSGWQYWQGQPLNPELQNRFSLKSALSLAFHGKHVEGRLFGLDKERMDSDDLVLGAIVARQAASQLDQFYLLKQLQQAAAMEERVRLARDLHDGLLQSLTAAALQLETVHRMMEEEPQAARERLSDIQRTIVTEQRNLRSHIRQLKPLCAGPAEPDQDLAGRLRELAERIERQWGPRIEMDLRLNGNEVPSAIADNVYFIIAEALFNAVRHANASSVRVELITSLHELSIAVADDGGGFPFHGRYDNAALNTLNIGPATLRERVASLRGTLALESTNSGARLDISVPLNQKGA
ncbi:MAG: sensor histidine kinase [Syntrophales bacterium]